MLGSMESNDNEPTRDNGGIVSIVMDIFRNPLAAVAGGLLAGLVIGLLIGWVFWPVQWTDASIEHLRRDLQQDWVRMTAITHGLDLASEETTRQRLDELGPVAAQVIEEVRANPGNPFTEEIGRAHV